MYMACRVGITTDPGTRRKEWEAAHPDLTDWRILAERPTKTEAQRAGETEALRAGCVAEAGAYGPESARWFVYYFRY